MIDYTAAAGDLRTAPIGVREDLPARPLIARVETIRHYRPEALGQVSGVVLADICS